MAIPTLPNFRDLGGHQTANGMRIKTGVLFRSVDLSRLDAPGAEALTEAGVQRIYDLRTAQECAHRPDKVPTGMSRVHLDVLADTVDDVMAAQMGPLMEDPRRLAEYLGGNSAVETMIGTYRGIVSSASALRSYRELILGIAATAEAGASGVLFHCTTGKDRTGWAAASVMTLLGVDHDAVVEDYLRTNTDLLPALQPIFDDFTAGGGDSDLLLPILGVREEYLQAAFDEVEKQFGSMSSYAAEGLGLSDSDLERLATALTH